MMSRLAPLVLILAAGAAPHTAGPPTRDPATLVVHEWGTFTSIAGEDGEAIDWWTLGGVQDLPCFVTTFRDFPKSGIGGTVRMETPVLYFYSPKDTAVDVSVRFRQGMLTEWYPRADAAPARITSPAGLATPGLTHTLTWSGVKVLPGAAEDYPKEDAPSHYYAARKTGAAPVQVGAQTEKFLFYRGVGRFPIPIAATVDAGGRAHVRNTGPDPLATVILFERRGDRIGYHVRHGVTGEISLDRPAMNAQFAALATELERMLIAQGLYAREASAMVATWRDSWFEEGTRLFYIVPAGTIEDVLPLTIEPPPSQVARVFVGRVELITAATRQDVADAIARRDPAGAAKYGRFLPSIVNRIFQGAPAGRTERLQADPVLQSAYASLATSARSCASTPASVAQSGR